MTIKKILLLWTSFLLVFTCTACSNMDDRIAVTIYPIQYVVERLGGNVVEITNISASGAIQSASVIDNFEEKIKDCKVLFYVGGLEPYFDVYSDVIRKEDLQLINLANKSVFYEFQRYTITRADGKNAVVQGPYYEGDIFKNVDVYKKDPMIWMDPISLISVAEIVRDYLIENHPEQRDVFEENYTQLEIDLTRLDMEYQRLKEVDQNIAFVSMTPSFGPWQKSYGISIYPICLSKYGALPSETQLAVIKQKIVDDGVEYIAYEPNLNEEMLALYNSLKEELGLKTIELSNISSLSLDQKEQNKDYLTIMYENLSVLEKISEE